MKCEEISRKCFLKAQAAMLCLKQGKLEDTEKELEKILSLTDQNRGDADNGS